MKTLNIILLLLDSLRADNNTWTLIFYINKFYDFFLNQKFYTLCKNYKQKSKMKKITRNEEFWTEIRKDVDFKFENEYQWIQFVLIKHRQSGVIH